MAAPEPVSQLEQYTDQHMVDAGWLFHETEADGDGIHFAQEDHAKGSHGECPALFKWYQSSYVEPVQTLGPGAGREWDELPYLKGCQSWSEYLI